MEKKPIYPEAVFVYELTPGRRRRKWNCGLQRRSCDPDQPELLSDPGGERRKERSGRRLTRASEPKTAAEGDETTGGGLAWGSGCSPSLTKDLVMFTDNQNPVNLLAAGYEERGKWWPAFP